MKTVVITLQHENWEDDGGDHDAFVAQISEDDYNLLIEKDTLYKSGDDSELYERILESVVSDPQFPMQIDNVLNVWYFY